MLAELQNFSIYDESLEHGLSQKMLLDVIYILNQKLWDVSGRRNNNKSAMLELSHRIFGEKAFHNKGILRRITERRRKKEAILGMYHLLLFRLYSCWDRRGGFSALYEALTYHADPSAKTEGQVSELTINEMRELSQLCYATFKELFLKKNIFREIEKLEIKSFVSSRKNQADFPHQESVYRNGIISFIIYQMANKELPQGSGVGCGYFDIEGTEDNGGIAKDFNLYLFEVCFSTEKVKNNGFYFIDAMLHFASEKDSDGAVILRLSNIEKVFDRDMLSEYWRKNRGTIKSLCKNSDRVAPDFHKYLPYADYSELLFKELDAFTPSP